MTATEVQRQFEVCTYILDVPRLLAHGSVGGGGIVSSISLDFLLEALCILNPEIFQIMVVWVLGKCGTASTTPHLAGL